jgi:tartrate dehydrogenase/decarboxylase/D-malate dehydrogenase
VNAGQAPNDEASVGTGTTKHRVAVLAGDGIGREVVPSAQRVLDAVGRGHGVDFDWVSFDWGCEYYTRTGRMMPQDGLEQLRPFEAIFLGAVGYPGVPDHVSLWGLLIPIRRAFQQYVNLRPVRLLPGIESPLEGYQPGDIDFVVVRENNEGEYSEVGGRLYRGTPQEAAVQEAVFTRFGVERVMRYSYELARSRGGRLDSATKSNGIVHTMPFWDEVFRALGAQYPDVPTREYHIDALAALFVLDPRRFDVVVASNLFGDILTDLGAAIVGSIGIAPSANLNPAREYPSMFEPVHGSAPDIAGQGIANPLGQIWSGAMMLEHLGHPEAAAQVVGAMEKVLGEGSTRTPDLGGTATTDELTDAVLDALSGRAVTTTLRGAEG